MHPPVGIVWGGILSRGEMAKHWKSVNQGKNMAMKWMRPHPGRKWLLSVHKKIARDLQHVKIRVMLVAQVSMVCMLRVQCFRLHTSVF